MSRSEELATAFERANRELIDFLSGLDREQWRARAANSPTVRVGAEDEQRPVGTVAHHVASTYARAMDGLEALASGDQMPAPSPGVNAAHAAANPDPDPAETLDLLVSRGAAVAAMIRKLSDEQLDAEVQTFLGRDPLATFVERGVIFHVTWHLSSIKATFS